MYYPRIDETVTFRRLKNGLPAYVVHKPGYTRKYAMFATRYGGMDLRFQLDGQWVDTPAGIAQELAPIRPSSRWMISGSRLTSPFVQSAFRRSSSSCSGEMSSSASMIGSLI